MRDIINRAIHMRPELAAELVQRGLFSPEEKAEIRRHRPGKQPRYAPLGPAQFGTLLAQGDAQIAGRAVLRGLLTQDELRWLERVLRFRKHNPTRDELVRTVERTLERGKGSAGKS
jgi:hypothetical protein